MFIASAVMSPLIGSTDASTDAEAGDIPISKKNLFDQ
jgi:hypothetical protein